MGENPHPVWGKTLTPYGGDYPQAVAEVSERWGLGPKIQWDIDVDRAPYPQNVGFPQDLGHPTRCQWFWCAFKWRDLIDTNAGNYDGEALWVVLYRHDPDECLDDCPWPWFPHFTTSSGRIGRHDQYRASCCSTDSGAVFRLFRELFGEQRLGTSNKRRIPMMRSCLLGIGVLAAAACTDEDVNGFRCIYPNEYHEPSSRVLLEGTWEGRETSASTDGDSLGVWWRFDLDGIR